MTDGHRGRGRPDRQAARPARRGHRRGPHRRARAALRAPARRSRAEPPARLGAAGSRADRARHPLAPGHAAGHASRSSPTAPPPRRPAGIAAARHDRRRRAPEDPEEFYDHQLVGLRGRTTSTATPLGEVDRRRARRRPGPAGRSARRTAASVLVPFVTALVPEVDVAGGRVVVADRPGPGHAAPRGRLRPDVRIDVVTIFPDYLAPLELSLRRQGARRAGCSTSASTTCATGPTTGTAPSTTPRTAAAPAW